MAGTPLACFYANLYLKELDEAFAGLGLPYARYSDDIIFFAPDSKEVQAGAALIHGILTKKGLRINPEKEHFFGPEDPWVFLGFICREGVMDIAPVSLQKLKAKMRRKTRA